MRPLVFLALLVTTFLPAATGEEIFGVFALTDTPRDSYSKDRGQRMEDVQRRGVRIRSLELSWREYEPQDDAWDLVYLERVRQELGAMRKLGFEVVLDLGLQYPPAWVTAIQPFRDNLGNVKTTQTGANTIFSPKVREEVAEYLQRLLSPAGIGTDFWGIRISSGAHPHGEILYPEGAAMNGYWAWDPDARRQCLAELRDFQPAPGHDDPRARAFYDWYCDSLAQTVYWMLAQVRATSYEGRLLLECPGVGIQPRRYERLVRDNCWSTTDDLKINVIGARYDKILAGLPDKRNVIVVCSSLNDSTHARPETGTYPDVETTWSSAHYLAYLADLHGLGKMGENTGQPPNDTEQMTRAFKKMREFGYSGLFWAWEYALYEGPGKASAEDLERHIAGRP
jgi:hypothetical protein